MTNAPATSTEAAHELIARKDNSLQEALFHDANARLEWRAAFRGDLNGLIRS